MKLAPCTKPTSSRDHDCYRCPDCHNEMPTLRWCQTCRAQGFVVVIEDYDEEE